MFRVRSACTAFPLKGNVIQTAEREGLLEGRFFMPNMKEMHTFIYTSDSTFRSMTNWVTSLINHVLLWKHLCCCGCPVHAPTWLFSRTWVNTSCHPAARSGGRPVWLFPQSPWKKGRVADRKNVPSHWGSPLLIASNPHSSTTTPSKTSTHWTHQVISWGLKYLLGKYLSWLSDLTS